MKKTITSGRTIRISLFILWIAQISVYANKPDSIYVPWYKYDFPKATENVLSDSAGTLLPFLSQLRGLRNDSAEVVSVVHIGDSHIQADMQTGTTRRLLQEYFGSAGRGLVAPLKLIKTNEPRNYRIESAQTWEGIRCIRPGTYPVGITGMVAVNRDSLSEVTVELLDLYNPDKWNFNDITVYYDTTGTTLNIPDSLPGMQYGTNTSYTQRIFFDSPVSSMSFIFKTRNQYPTLFYGANLRNGRNGILYHAIGINGAHYEEYANAGLFMEQLPSLDASLIILSMGTNEAYDSGFNAESFYRSMDRTIRLIREKCPDALFILTTPAETWYHYRTKNKKPHPNMVIAHDVIVQYAKEHQLAYWDLFSITGGKGSARAWKEHNLLSRDGVHFSKEGYEYIGELLFEAIYNAYRNNQ